MSPQRIRTSIVLVLPAMLFWGLPCRAAGRERCPESSLERSRAALLAIYVAKGKIPKAAPADSRSGLPSLQGALRTLECDKSPQGAVLRRLAAVEIVSAQKSDPLEGAPSFDDPAWRALERLGSDSRKIFDELHESAENESAHGAADLAADTAEGLVEKYSKEVGQCCSAVTRCCVKSEEDEAEVDFDIFLWGSGGLASASRLLDPGKWDECDDLHFQRVTIDNGTFPPDPPDVQTPSGWMAEEFFEHFQILEENCHFKNVLSISKSNADPSLIKYKLSSALAAWVGPTPTPGPTSSLLLTKDEGEIRVTGPDGSVTIGVRKAVAFSGPNPLLADSLRMMADWLRAYAVCKPSERRNDCIKEQNETLTQCRNAPCPQ